MVQLLEISIMKHLQLLFIIAILCFGCSNEKKESDQSAATTIDTLTAKKPQSAIGSKFSLQDSIKATGIQVLSLLKHKKYEELSMYFAEDGVRFSPYGHIDTLKCKKLNATDFMEAINKNWVLTWGNLDGTGAPIKLTVKNYLNKFVYNADYLDAEAVGFDEVIKKGNSLLNLETLYPKHHFIDYHFSGFEQKNQGMDWTSLKLVFEKQQGEYFLVAVVHDQWTI